jgi:hypothetical protein
MGQQKRCKSFRHLNQQRPLIFQVSLAFSAAKLYINNQDPTHPGQQTLNILLGRTAKLVQMTREFSQIDPDGKWMELGRRVETAYHQFHNNLKDQGDCRDDLVRGHAVDNLVESLNTLANEHQTAAIKHPTHPSTQCSIFVDPDRGVKWPGEDGTTYSANIFGGFSSPSKIGSMKLWLKDTKR